MKRIFDKIRIDWSRTQKRWRLVWHTRLRQHASFMKIVMSTIELATFLGAIGFLICFVMYIGYERTPEQQMKLQTIISASRWLFASNVIVHLLLDSRDTITKTRTIKWIVDAGILLSLCASVIHIYASHLLPDVAHILCSSWFMMTVLLAYSIVDISYGIMQIMNRRTNPPLLLATSFIIFIIVGSLLLMLPRSTFHGIEYIDALFVSTSAVCITGLSSVDIPSTFTPFGQVILAILIQIGGLGVLTFTSFFAIFFSGNTSIYSQLMVKDMINSRSFNELGPTLIYIFVFTMLVELAGAAAVWWSVHDILPGLNVSEQIRFALFHSLSAFCNAGFSTLPGGMANPALMNSNQSIYLVTSLIVMAGAIGFPVLVNLRNAFNEYMRRLFNRIRHRNITARAIHLYNLNTKLSLYTMLLVFAISAVAFYIFERHNSMQGMSIYTQTCQSVFNATCPRSSGFMSLNPLGFSPVTMLMIIMLMWIGGASQSTAGGIKVNTVATSLLNLRATILGKNKVVTCNRTISSASIKRANAVIALSIFSLFLFTTAMLLLEPELPPKSIIFETISALFTVGSSFGITEQLSTASKIVLSTAMFLGRVGIISMLIGITGNRTNSPVSFPTDNIIIN